MTDFRRRHALYKTDEFSSNGPTPGCLFIATLDNHDAVIDVDPAGLARRAAAYQAWYEHMPTRGYGKPGDNRFQLGRTIRAGRLAQINLLDTRQFRAEQSLCGDGDPAYGFGNYRPRCPEMFAEERSMLGQEQEHRLVQSILNNTAAWNVLATSSVFSPFRLEIDQEDFALCGFLGCLPG